MRPTRRSFLAGAASLAALRHAQAANDADTVIIGAGAAGLAAAKQLRATGRSFVVLEARARIGGRAYTDTSLGAAFDAGAQYIHWIDRNPWVRIAGELGVRIQDDDRSSDAYIFRNGERLSASEVARRRGAFGRAWSLLNASPGEDRSFADALRERPEEMVSAAAAITRLSLGEEPERVSLADYDQLWAGEDYLLPDGYGTLVTRYGADIPVRLETPVTRIRWDGGGVEIETARGTLKAAAAIVTVPIGVLKADGIRFSPELPDATRAALDGLQMGAYTKIALKMDRSRVGSGEAADFFEIGKEGEMTSLEFWPFGRDLAVAYLGGDHARGLCEAGEAAAVDYVGERLGALLGTNLRRAVTGGRLAGWWTDPYARGSYSIAKPGHAGAREALRTPVGDRIWLAGEATAGGGAMTAGGATLDGERAAQEVVRRISR